MVKKIAVLIRKHFPEKIYRWVQESYRYLNKPIVKKNILDSSLFSRLCKSKTYPDELFIFLTTRCNIRCLICRRENHKPIDLKYGNLVKLTEPIKHAKIIDLTGWGEPFLYKNIDDVISLILKTNKRSNLIRITTNGTLLSKKKGQLLNNRLYHLTISLNAATESTYNRDMQHSDFKCVIANIKEFISALDDITISKINLHFVAHAANYAEIPEFITLAKSLGIMDVSIGNYIISTDEHIHLSLLHYREKYNEIIELARKKSIEDGVFFSARKFYEEKDSVFSSINCFYPYTQFFVQPDGEVSGPCCYAGLYPLGNVYSEEFNAIWFGEKYNKLREKRHLPACQICTAFSPFDSLNTHFDAVFYNKNREKLELLFKGEIPCK